MKTFKDFIQESNIIGVLKAINGKNTHPNLHDVGDRVKISDKSKEHSNLKTLNGEVTKRHTNKNGKISHYSIKLDNDMVTKAKAGHVVKEAVIVKETNNDDVSFATDSLKDEIEAIDKYNHQIERTQCPELKKILEANLADEHKHKTLLEGWLQKNSAKETIGEAVSADENKEKMEYHKQQMEFHQQEAQKAKTKGDSAKLAAHNKMIKKHQALHDEHKALVYKQ